ncbi:MAG: hypothetical protein JWN70_3442, partial [Planctomycetaceae bacterium]|nr:hypothetical protein [Planctomycetaceae bacterium]
FIHQDRDPLGLDLLGCRFQGDRLVLEDFGTQSADPDAVDQDQAPLDVFIRFTA